MGLIWGKWNYKRIVFLIIYSINSIYVFPERIRNELEEGSEIIKHTENQISLTFDSFIFSYLIYFIISEFK